MKILIYRFKEVDNFKGKKVLTLDRSHNKNTSLIWDTVTQLYLSPCALCHGRKQPYIDPSTHNWPFACKNPATRDQFWISWVKIRLFDLATNTLTCSSCHKKFSLLRTMWRTRCFVLMVPIKQFAPYVMVYILKNLKICH
jgi:hypothetical protein